MGKRDKKEVEEGEIHEVSPSKTTGKSKGTCQQSKKIVVDPASKEVVVGEFACRSQLGLSEWQPNFTLDGAPLTSDASIRDWQKGKAP